jgi:hypothetical protein
VTIKTWDLLVLFLLATSLVRADYGPRFLVDAQAPVRLQGAGAKISYRFTCFNGGLLSQVSVFCTGAQKPLLTRAALCEDSGGFPADRILRSAEFLPNPGAWSSLDFSGVRLQKGKVYHVVLEQDLLRDDGDHLASPQGPEHVIEADLKKRWADFAATSPLNRRVPFGDPDSALQTLAFDGHSWTELGRQPAYLLSLGSGLTEGNPCALPLAAPVYAGLQQAQVLHFNCEFQPRALQARLRKAGKPVAPLQYRILEWQYLTGRYVEFYRGEVQPAQVPDSWAWVTIPLDPRGPIVRVECFYVAFASQAGQAFGPDSCRDCYQVDGMRAPAGAQGAAEATFDGGAHRSRASTSEKEGPWADDFEADLNVVLTGVDCETRRQPDPILPVAPVPRRFSDVWEGDGR